MKRKLLMLSMILMALLISVGGTVAYLTDVEQEINVMTLGRVEIDLIEEERSADGTLVEFKDNHPLYPGVYRNGLVVGMDGYWIDVRNAVDKVVSVKNVGKAPAYVRLWFAFEVTDDDTFFDAKVHLNKNTRNWQWDFLKNEEGPYEYLLLDGSRYVIATAVFNQVLGSGSQTPDSLRQVLLDSTATNDDYIALGDKYSIFVVAQGMQAEGFDDAISALNEGFGEMNIKNHPFAGMMEENAGDILTSPTSAFEWKKTDDGKGIIITSYKGDAAEVGIPPIIDGLPVTEIGEKAFYYCYNLTGVSIPDSVTIIDGNAFDSCWNLKRAPLPSSLLEIGDHAFYSTDLNNLIFPDGMAKIGNWAFYNCQYLTSITIPGSVKKINEHAFTGCEGLTEVIIQDGVESIGKSAFSGCDSLEKIIIPESVTEINQSAFSNCPNITAFVRENSYAHNWCIAKNISYVLVDENGSPILPDTNLFSWKLNDDGESVTITGYSGAEENLEIPAIIDGHAVTAIENNAFYNCSSLISVEIPESITTIEHGAFFLCKNLVTVNLPNSLTEIGAHAFACCYNLQNINLPSNIQSIGEGIFKDCKSLQTIIWPESLDTISRDAFGTCESLTSVVIPSSVRTIETWAFFNCYSLEEVIIPEGVTTIGDDVFTIEGEKMAKIYVPRSVTSIGDCGIDAKCIYVKEGSYAHTWCIENNASVDFY